jgi:hypothetical protein
MRCMQGQLAPALTWQAELLAAHLLLDAHQPLAWPRHWPQAGVRRAARPCAAAAASASSCARFCWAPWAPAWPLGAVLPQLLPVQPPPPPLHSASIQLVRILLWHENNFVQITPACIQLQLQHA